MERLLWCCWLVGGIGDDETAPRFGFSVSVVSLAKVDATVVRERVAQPQTEAALTVIQVTEFRTVDQRHVVLNPNDLKGRRT